MKKQGLILIVILLLSGAVNYCTYGQNVEIDSSYTVHNTFIKEHKRYPQIVPIERVLPDSVEEIKNIVYKSQGNRALHLDIYKAKKHGNHIRPVVILIHGGGWKSGDKSMMQPLAIRLAEHGFSSVTIEYRRSPEALYPAAVTDVKTAIRWVRLNAEAYGFNPHKIAVMGGSSGGHMAALIGATNNTSMYIDQSFAPEISSDVQAVIDIDGILAFIHPESGEGADKPGRPSAATCWLGGDQQEKRALWLEASPITHANRSMPPTLFINSQFERFHAGRDDLIARLDSFEIYTEVHKVDNSPHPFWLFHPWFDQTAEWSILFLEKILIKEK